MAVIHRLDETLSNQIAAGEVVERPASVVKELLENSIDGQAKSIDIELEEGGLQLIRIVDDGIGMQEEDAVLSIERHATSKISSVHDLFRIHSLGFRGEALPSIASVSMFEMHTATGDGPGTRIVVQGGKMTEQGKSHSRKGTEITVQNLFYNTPARLKYMKSISTELGHVMDVIQKLSLSFPELSFRVTHNGKKVFQTLGTGQVSHVLALLYGREHTKNMKPISAGGEGFSIQGYIGAPDLNRSNRNCMYISVNHRIVKNYQLNRSIVLGYEGQLMKGRYPVVYIALEVEPILVDVNVHPSKQEVKLSKEKEIGLALEQTIAQKLKETQYIARGIGVYEDSIKKTRGKKPKVEQQRLVFEEHQQTFMGHTPISQVQPYEKTTIGYPILKKPYIVSEKQYNEQIDLSHFEEAMEEPNRIFEKGRAFPKAKQKSQDKPVFECDATQDMKTTNDEIGTAYVPKLATLYPVGQVHGTYMIAQNEAGMYLIDQHAAQERLFYDLNRKRFLHKQFVFQPLLIPITLELTKAEALIVEEKKGILAQLGIELEAFGERTYIVREHPNFFPAGSEEELIQEIIHHVIASKEVREELIREDALAMMSCKASIKANHRLSEQEMFQLLEDLRHSESPYTCPHGRPILIHFTPADLEKMFKRQV